MLSGDAQTPTAGSGAGSLATLVFVGRPWYRYAFTTYLHKPGDNICAARGFLRTSVGCMRVSRTCVHLGVHVHTSDRQCTRAYDTYSLDHMLHASNPTTVWCAVHKFVRMLST